jgi:8-oxo-dGTP diphosphatase
MNNYNVKITERPAAVVSYSRKVVPKIIRVTAAILMNEEKVFIAKRKAEGHLPLHWEFPGGKVNDGETPEQSLTREIREELGIKIKVLEHFETVFHEYIRGKIELMAFYVEWLGGEIKLTEHVEYRWVAVEELSDYELSPADLPIARKLLNLK